MSRVLTDSEIEDLLAERKPLPANWRTRLGLREKSGQRHRQREFQVSGDAGHTFRVVLRQSLLNPFDFSLILTCVDKDGAEYRLIRFNGRHPSQHTNKWEKARGLSEFAFRSRFHIHRGTERYQVDGLEIDGYAEVTEQYDSFESALDLFVRSNGLEAEGPGDDAPLFRPGSTGETP